MRKGLTSFLILVKKEREEVIRAGIFAIIFMFFSFYSLRLLNFPIIFAATPTPNPPTVTSSPEPQKGGTTITFSSNAQPGAPNELIKLIVCKVNNNLCVLGSQWSYRKPITISNSGSNTLTDYQVLVTLDTASLISSGKMRSDCGDIRLADSDGATLLSYWVESGCNSANTKIWVKVPNIPGGSTKTIYVYYGNSQATTLSDGAATFLLFDDFIGTSLDPNKWTYGSRAGGRVSVDNGYLKLAPASTWDGIFVRTVQAFPFPNISVEIKFMLDGVASSGSPHVHNFATYFINPTADYPRDTTYYYTISGTLPAPLFATNFAPKPHQTSYSGTKGGSVGTGETAGWYVSNYWDVSNLAVFSLDWYRISTAITNSILKQEAYRSTVGQVYTKSGNVNSTHLSGIGSQAKIELILWGYVVPSNRIDWVFIRKYASPEPTISVGSEETLVASNYIYTQSPAVSSSPSATYTCPSCQYSSNTYYGVVYSVNESVWTIFTGAQTFTCKMEASQSGSCSCSTHTQCYNPCNQNWGSYYDGYCYNSKCYDAIPGTIFGNTQSCLAGTLLNHETSLGRYANVNGRLYYCKGADNSVSPYPFVFNLSPGSAVGNCKCLENGNWTCPTGVIPVRGGRIRIV